MKDVEEVQFAGAGVNAGWLEQLLNLEGWHIRLRPGSILSLKTMCALPVSKANVGMNVKLFSWDG